MKQVEVEGGELALQNSNGDIAIIPKKYRREVEDMIKDNCHGCLDKFIATLPKSSDYAEGGSLYEAPIEPDDPPVEPIKNPVLSREDYQNKIQTNYKQFIKDTPSIPLFDLKDGKNHEGMNCINGVCNFISGTTNKQFNKGNIKSTVGEGTSYSGNATFNDHRNDEGYYEVQGSDLIEGGFSKGDIIQYARDKGSAYSRFPGEITDKNKFDKWPVHAKVIVDERQDESGKTFYTIVDNVGHTKWRTSEISREELTNHYTKGYNDGLKPYRSLIVNRYDPEKIAIINSNEKSESERLKGITNYEYPEKPALKFDYESSSPDKRKVGHLVEDTYNNNYEKISKISGVSPEILDKMVEMQVGISGKETKHGNSLAAEVQNLIPEGSLLKISKDVRDRVSRMSDTNQDDWITDYWDRNKSTLEAKYGTKKDFEDLITAKYGTFNQDQIYEREKQSKKTKSKGLFKQKNLSPTGEILVSNKETWADNESDQFLASIGLMIDNYHNLRNKYPDLSDENILDLSVLSHSSPGKANIKEYVDYYLPINEIDYVNDVKSMLMTSRIGNIDKKEPIKLPTQKPKTTVNKENPIKTKEEVNSILSYVNSLNK